MIYLKQFLLLLLFNIVYSVSYTGYIRTIEMSFCMDECGQHYIENEEGQFLANVILPQDSDLYLDRYVYVFGEFIECVTCEALLIDEISISDDCEYVVPCFADPCEVSECSNFDFECIPNFCGGCYADFYDLNGSLHSCGDVIVDDCFDVSNIFFGMCDMYLGVAVVDGVCQGVSGCGWEVGGVDYSNAFHVDIDYCEDTCLDVSYTCEDIEDSYNQLHSNFYSTCDLDNDCIPVWGHCDVGLGGCHYSVNVDNYPFFQINALVNDWDAYNCDGGVCDCMGLPNAICNNGECDLVYCYEQNPSGCYVSGCDDGYVCVDDPNNCVPSSCFCDDSVFGGSWICTEDCGGGTCVLSLSGDVNYDGFLNVSDIVIIVNMILGNMDISLNGDVNADGIVDVIDVVMIINDILNND